MKPRPLRILYVWDADYPWDVRTEKICAALTAAGHHVEIVARNRRWDAVTDTLPEGAVHRMRPLRWLGRRLDAAASFPAFFNPRWIRLIAARVRATAADCVIVRDLPLCPTAALVGRRYGVPVILDMAEDYPAMMQALWETQRNRPLDVLVRNPAAVRAVERWCITAVSHILVVVDEARDRLRELGVQSNAISVVSNTPQIRRVSERPRADLEPGERLRVTYLGNVEVGRGLLEAVDAVRLLRDRGVPVHLRVIGAGRDLDLVRTHAAQRELNATWVRFDGFVPYQQALRELESAHVGIVPHRANREWLATVPNKLFDYMAAGLPVVASDVPPVARILRETGAGVLFRSSDAGSLAAALSSVASTPRLRQLGAAGQLAIRSKYNWERDERSLIAAVAGVVAPAALRSAGPRA